MKTLAALFILLAATVAAPAACIPVAEAPAKIGQAFPGAEFVTPPDIDQPVLKAFFEVEGLAVEGVDSFVAAYRPGTTIFFAVTAGQVCDDRQAIAVRGTKVTELIAMINRWRARHGLPGMVPETRA